MEIRKRFPAVARQNLYIVSDATARAALAPATVIDGDLVVQKDTDELWTYNAGSWARIASKALAFTYTDSASINFTYDAGTQDLTAALKLSAAGPDAGYRSVALDEQADGIRAQVSDEDIQDAAFSIVGSSNSISVTYNDAGNTIGWVVNFSADAPDLNNIKANLSNSLSGDGIKALILKSDIRGLFSGNAPISYDSATGAFSLTQSGVDHGSIGGLTDDDHSQYALLAGRSSGQVLKGGTAASENLTLHSTDHVTKGNVEFADGVKGTVTADATAGTISDYDAVGKFITRFSAATTINSIAGGVAGKLFILINANSAACTITNNSGGTAANRIITGSGADIVLQAGASLFLAYDATSSRWRVIGGAGGGGFLVVAVQSISAAGTIARGSGQRQILNVQGNGAAVTVNSTTGITNGTVDGEETRLIGRDSTNTVTLASSGNLALNGSCTLAAGDVLDLFWDGTSSVWRESSRSA